VTGGGNRAGCRDLHQVPADGRGRHRRGCRRPPELRLEQSRNRIGRVPAGRIVAATLGDDVNLRDVEGRSALLLGKAKDNNGSCAIGPFLRFFDTTPCPAKTKFCPIAAEPELIAVPPEDIVSPSLTVPPAETVIVPAAFDNAPQQHARRGTEFHPSVAEHKDLSCVGYSVTGGYGYFGALLGSVDTGAAASRDAESSASPISLMPPSTFSLPFNVFMIENTRLRQLQKRRPDRWNDGQLYSGTWP
jgi:hypothetical protein